MPTNAEKRLARSRLLADELRSKCDVNTEQSRARCKKIALELIGLLQAEDDYQRSVKAIDGRAATDDEDPSELTRLVAYSDRKKHS